MTKAELESDIVRLQLVIKEKEKIAEELREQLANCISKTRENKSIKEELSSVLENNKRAINIIRFYVRTRYKEHDSQYEYVSSGGILSKALSTDKEPEECVFLKMILVELGESI